MRGLTLLASPLQCPRPVIGILVTSPSTTQLPTASLQLVEAHSRPWGHCHVTQIPVTCPFILLRSTTLAKATQSPLATLHHVVGYLTWHPTCTIRPLYPSHGQPALCMYRLSALTHGPHPAKPCLRHLSFCQPPEHQPNPPTHPPTALVSPHPTGLGKSVSPPPPTTTCTPLEGGKKLLPTTVLTQKVSTLHLSM